MLLPGFLLLLQVSPPISFIDGRGAPSVAVPRIEADVTVDGVLDELVWSRAARLSGFSQYEPVDGRPAEEQTEVRVWYAPDAIFFGILAHDSQPAAIRATRADRDNIDGEDHVIVYLDTFNDRRRAFFFAVNPLGIQQDGIRSEGAASAGQMFGSNIDRSPDYVFDSRGRITDTGYQVEIRIPFKSLRYAGNGPQTWGFNVLRKVQRTGYTDTWTDVRRASASFLVQAGTLEGLQDLHRGVVLEAQPFLTAKANGTRLTSGAFERENVDPDVGLNLRLGFTNIAADATLNPDFSQVESDAAQVTVNERFALFFAEKRPFFLEGIDLFNTPNQLVYTRRIANPIAGAKLTGKMGSIGVAHITAVDDAAPSDALFNISRLRRDFGSNSLVGITFSDRSELDWDGARVYNRVIAADARIVFARLYFLETQLGRSWSSQRDSVAGAVKIGDPLWRLAFDRTGRTWGFNYTVNAIGDEFQSDAGFVPRTDIVEARGFNRFSIYGARGALIESFTVFFGPSRIWRYGELIDEAAVEGRENVNLMVRLRGGWQLNSDMARNFVRLDPFAFQDFSTTGPGGPLPYAPLDEVSGPIGSLSITTPTGRLADVNTRFQRGRIAIFAEGSEGNSTQITTNINLRPGTGLRINFTNTFQRITRRRDGSEFARTIIPRLRLEFQPVRAFFFRTVAQYSSERRAALEDARTGSPLLVAGSPASASHSNALRVDLLASFEPTPGTVAFFGYGSSLNAPDAFAFHDLSRSADGFFLKLAYQFRR